MLVLLIFALLAGAGTALTPCVLPVLPALLSASATGGRRRPAGIAIGLVVCHTLAVVALATVIDGVGLASGTVRAVAVVVLAVFGLALIWPRLGDAVERPLQRLARFGPRDSGHGFWSGLAVGGALGFVYAPCAGPILAAVVAAGATGGTTGRIVAWRWRTGSAPAWCCSRWRSVAGRCSPAWAGGPRFSARSERSWCSQPWRWAPSWTCASRPRWPTTCRSSWSTPRGRSSDPPRPRRGWRTCVARRSSTAQRPSRVPRRMPPRPRRATWTWARRPGSRAAGSG